jgi:TPP-dependent pyruvate/acetoin dehydrogenase alpha subunit
MSITNSPPEAYVTGFKLLPAYQVMRLIREFEDRVHAEYPNGEIPGAVHLYAGQEAIAAGVCAHLGVRDYIASTHRGHGHAIAKGSDVNAMMLEIYGKARGLCRGRGGSMHIADFGLGMLGANGVAAGGVPLACGAALTAKLMNTGQIAVAFVGDGGANQGAFAESLCLASVWQLPVVFVVEDNGYAQATGSPYHLGGVDVAERATAFGMPASVVDGYDFFKVHQAAGEAIERARAGQGPSLIECKAVRFYGHMEGWDAQRYRPADEADRLKAERDPLRIFAEHVIGEGLLTQEDLDEIDAKVRTMMDGAVAMAKSAADPEPATIADDVYASL